MKLALFVVFLMVDMGLAEALSRWVARRVSPSGEGNDGNGGLRVPFFSAVYFLLTVGEFYPILPAAAVIDALTFKKRTRAAEARFFATLIASVAMGLAARHWMGP